MMPAKKAYLESQLASFSGDFEMEYALESDPVPTGIAPLDEALGGGLACGTYTIVGGMAGVGKSALGVSVLYGMAAKGMFPIYVSCEMPAQQVRMRMASIHSTVADGLEPFAWSRARDHFRRVFDEEQLKRYREADEDRKSEWARRYIGRFGGSNPVLLSWRSLQECGIAQRAMVREDIVSLEGVCGLIEERASFGLRDAVIVDYAQILDVPDADGEYERMTQVSRSLQQAARNAGCPVLLISSLSNNGNQGGGQGKKKDDPQPSLTWFRGSGYLGYDAGAAIVLKKGALKTVDSVQMDAYILKNRQGMVPDGPVSLTARPKYGTFE